MELEFLARNRRNHVEYEENVNYLPEMDQGDHTIRQLICGTGAVCLFVFALIIATTTESNPDDESYVRRVKSSKNVSHIPRGQFKPLLIGLGASNLPPGNPSDTSIAYYVHGTIRLGDGVAIQLEPIREGINASLSSPSWDPNAQFWGPYSRLDHADELCLNVTSGTEKDPFRDRIGTGCMYLFDAVRGLNRNEYNQQAFKLRDANNVNYTLGLVFHELTELDSLRRVMINHREPGDANSSEISVEHPVDTVIDSNKTH